MENQIQIAFNVIVVGIIYIVILVASYRAKLSKNKGIDPVKEASAVLTETLGAGVLLLFLIFGVFVVGLWGG